MSTETFSERAAMSGFEKQDKNAKRSGPQKRVLIASANPLFAKGLMKIYGERWGSNAVELSLAISMGETLSRLDEWEPDMVIVDYDDRTIHREEFLSHFIFGDRPMQVVLVSLQASGEVVVYDRRTMTPAQAEDWLSLPWQPVSKPSVKHPPKRREGFMKGSGKHFVFVGILVVAMTAVLYLGMRAIGLLPTAAAVQAETVDQLFYVHFFMIALLFSLIGGFLIYSIVVFRAKPGDLSAGAFFKGNSRLEVFWTIIPLVTVVAFSFFGARNLAETRRVDPDAMVVKVTASQWAWQFEYPDYGIKSRELYLPVNKQVLFRLTSRDVIHSFWVPEFRIKQDALPGENLVKELRITPIKNGKYTLLCAELCGGAHADMTAPVVVVSQTDFEAWVATQLAKTVKDPAERGKTYVDASGCLSCHSVDGTRLSGPTFTGLYGSARELEGASTVNADEAYLRQAIVDPNAQIVKGYAPNVHPGDYASVLTEQQVTDMIEFVKTLK
jgi:cytochrome c oxidase subunit II